METITVNGKDYLKCRSTANLCFSSLVGFGGKEFDCAFRNNSCKDMKCHHAIYLEDTPEFRHWLVLQKLEDT